MKRVLHLCNFFFSFGWLAELHFCTPACRIFSVCYLSRSYTCILLSNFKLYFNRKGKKIQSQEDQLSIIHFSLLETVQSETRRSIVGKCALFQEIFMDAFEKEIFLNWKKNGALIRTRAISSKCFRSNISSKWCTKYIRWVFSHYLDGDLGNNKKYAFG